MQRTQGEAYAYDGAKGHDYIAWFLKNEKRLKFTNQSGTRYIRTGSSAAVDAAIAEFDLDKCKAMAKAKVDAEAYVQFEVATSQYHPIETGTWVQKQLEAAQVLDWDSKGQGSPSPQTVFIAGEAGSDPAAQIALATKINNNKDALTLANNAIASVRHTKKTTIDAATTYADVEAVSPIDGWPFQVPE